MESGVAISAGTNESLKVSKEPANPFRKSGILKTSPAKQPAHPTKSEGKKTSRRGYVG